MSVVFTALVKEVRSKALVSGDKSVRILLETEDLESLKSAMLPSDASVKITIENVLP